VRVKAVGRQPSPSNGGGCAAAGTLHAQRRSGTLNSRSTVRHTHPGEEIIYVLAGSLEYQVDGQPTKVYNAGEVLTVPAGVIHAVRNAGTGTGTGTALATDIVEKGKPLLTVAE
jgi:mannose-6-phosphate isomerase-like protein (cupin superfamily)